MGESETPQPPQPVRMAKNPQMVKNYTEMGLSVPNARLLTYKDLSLIRKGKTIERLKKTNEALTQTALVDSLTGLYTRKFLDGDPTTTPPIPSGYQSEIGRARRLNIPLGVAMFDADWFKKINDEYGHAVGDIVLRTIAKQVQGNIRVSDRAIRYGGEEILLLLPDTTGEQAFILAEKLRKVIENFNFTTVGVSQRQVTVSVGVAAFNEPGNAIITPENLIETADKALYEAKHMGRNKTVLAKKTSYKNAAPLTDPVRIGEKTK